MLDERCITDELQRIADALLGVQQDRAPLQGGPIPRRLLKAAQLMSAALPTPFVFLSTLPIVALRQQRQRPIPMRLGVIGLQLNRPLVAL